MSRKDIVMQILRSILGSGFASVFVWSFMALFNVVFWTLIIFFLPYTIIKHRLQRFAPSVFGAPDEPDPEDVALFDTIWSDLSAGNLDALAHHAETHESFPHGVDPFIGRHWMTNAVDSGSVASTRWMIEQGMELNYTDDEGNSPLSSALQQDHQSALDLVSLLLESGADPNYRLTLDRTALHTAACLATPDIVQLLLERGANPHAYDSDYVPARPIDDAISMKRRDVVQVLEEWMREHPAD